MQIDLRTVSITPLRQTFDHIAARTGDKPASRYLEGTMDVQAGANPHYRPTWDPEHEIFDATRTRITMRDWYALKDPRQFYYGSYTQSRARMQDAAEADFDLVESRDLAAAYDATARRTALNFYLPLRHAAWGANLNGAAECAYGFGTAITQACLYQGMDQLGIAQYITRLGLTLGEPADLTEAKKAWLEAPEWQELRRYVEDTFVLKDWFELFVAQNVVLDSLLFALAYGEVDRALAAKAGPLVSMLTRFQAEWSEESNKWADSILRTVASENAANKKQLGEWIAHWQARAQKALLPIARIALGDGAGAALDRVTGQLAARLAKAGVSA